VFMTKKFLVEEINMLDMSFVPLLSIMRI
jgi:hypothetical protein